MNYLYDLNKTKESVESGLFKFKKHIPKANVWHVTYALDEIWLYLIIFLFLSDIDLYVHFHTPNYHELCLQGRMQSFFGRLFTAGSLKAAVTPPLDSWQSHGGGSRDRVPGNSEDLGI